MTLCNKELTPELIQNLHPAFYWEQEGIKITNQRHIDHVVDTGRTISNEDQEAFDALDCIIPTWQKDDYPQWIFLNINKKVITAGTTGTIKVNGCYFNPNLILSIDDVALTPDSFSCQTTLSGTYDTSNTAPGIKRVLIDGVKVGEVKIIDNTWVDFRLGGDSVNLEVLELEKINSNTIIRDENGIGSSDLPGWSGLIGIPEFSIDRNTTDGCQLVFHIQLSGSAMFGMIASEHRSGKNIYTRAHVGGYVSSPTNFWGFYAFANEANSSNLSQFTRVKLNFPSTLTPGSVYEVYGLSKNDGFEDGTLLYTSTIPSGDQEPGAQLYPCLIPNTATFARLQAFNTIGNA